jgi:hypothetical protein
MSNTDTETQILQESEEQLNQPSDSAPETSSSVGASQNDGLPMSQTTSVGANTSSSSAESVPNRISDGRDPTNESQFVGSLDSPFGADDDDDDDDENDDDQRVYQIRGTGWSNRQFGAGSAGPNFGGQGFDADSAGPGFGQGQSGRSNRFLGAGSAGSRTQPKRCAGFWDRSFSEFLFSISWSLQQSGVIQSLPAAR